MRTIAIVGRPNVGKSALFNRLCGHRIAIVDEAEGVTRDRLYQETEVFGVPFRLIDTGGIAPVSPSATFQEQITQQAQLAAEEADGIIMVVDATAGITTLDELVASYLRRLGKPICLAVNKLDSWDQLERVHEFRSLGIDPIVGVSAVQGLQMAELAEALLQRIPEPVSEEASPEEIINLSIVGRPNVGKSTLMNRILGEERSIVSPLAGTTRDSIDALFEQNGRTYRLIDTAGIRRKRAEKEVVDKFAAVRTERAVDRSDVCILMVDAQEGVTVQERRIIHWIEEEGKGCLILLNKWDLVPGFRMEHCVQALQEEIPFLRHVPFLCIAAQTGRNVSKIYHLVEEIYEARRRRISTGQLNKFMEKAIQACHPPMLQGGRRLRIYYLAQVSVAPPHFVLFVNDPALMTETYQRYLLNGLRKEYNFAGVPLFFTLRAKEKSRRKAPSSQGLDHLSSEGSSWEEEETGCQSFEEDDLSS